MIAALVASLVLVTAATRGRRRLVLAGMTVAVFAGGVLVSQIPKPISKRPGIHRVVRPSNAVVRNAELALPLDQEIGAENGAHPSIRRRLFGSSGRSQAWGGALHTAAHRPVAGYGFGTEERAFVDRYYTFDSGRPENSYIGALLQLGIVGLVLLIGLAAWAFWRYARRPADLAAPAAACLAGGLVLGITQSYLFSVGNDATLAVWFAWFMLVAATARPRPAG